MDAFERARQVNAEGQRKADLERLRREREGRRDHQPMPEGGLFDLVSRDQLGLFEEPR